MAYQRVIPFSFLFFLGTLINLLTSAPSFSTPENDRYYRIEGVAVLPPINNLDGIFNTPIQDLAEKVMKDHPRFSFRRSDGLQKIFSESTLPYFEAVKDALVIKRTASALGVDSLVRVKLNKLSDQFDATFEWVIASRSEVIARVGFSCAEHEIMGRLETALRELIEKAPFLGHISGIDGDKITLNRGRDLDLKKGQRLKIETLAEVKKHPLTLTVEEWIYKPVGLLEIYAVDDTLAFAKPIHQEGTTPFLRYQKITEVLAPAPLPTESTTPQDLKDPLRMGWVRGALGFHSYAREMGPTSGTAKSESNLGLGTQVDGLAWLNSRFLAEMGLRYSFVNHQNFSGNWSQFRLALGAALNEVKNITGTKLWGRVGFKSQRISLTTDSTALTGVSSLQSGFIGISGDYALDSTLTLHGGLDWGLIRSEKQNSPNFGSPEGSTDLSGFFGASYRWKDNIWLNATFSIDYLQMDFVNGANADQTLFSILPSVMIYF